MNTTKMIPFRASHPGEVIKDELEVRKNMNQKELAILLGVKPSFLNEIIKGKRPVTADIAILLEKILGIDADFWLRFQMQYEINNAKIKEKNQKKIKHVEIWETIKKHVPIKDLKKQKLLNNDLVHNITVVFNTYLVTNIDELVTKFTK